MKIKPLFFILFYFTVVNAQEQRWPRMMQLVEGKIVEIRYRGDTGFSCLDYTGKPIPGMQMDFNTMAASKFLYVDSIGKPISDALYDAAMAFSGGIAMVSSPRFSVKAPPRTYAVINERSEYVAPFSTEEINILRYGLYTIDKKTKQEVYDRFGKKIAECSGCGIGLNNDMKHIVMAPRSGYKEERIVKLLDLEGREVFSRPGEFMTQVNNDISNNAGTFLNPQPYYELVIDGQKNLKAIVSAKGKIVMDSIGSIYFTQGKATITKNKTACVVDTNFKILMPWSYGYDFYREMYKHPQGAYSARKNGRYMVIDPSGKQLVAVTTVTYEITYRHDLNMYEARDAKGKMWFVSLNGDTVVSPLKYTVDAPLYPLLPGFLVKPNGSDLTGYMSETGKLVIPCEYDRLAYGGNTMFIFFKNGKAGYLDTKGNVKFYIANALKLSAFFEGYALCAKKVTDASKGSPSAQTVSTAEGTYQVQNTLIDSTGKTVSDDGFDWLFLLKGGYAAVIKYNDTYMVDKQLRKVVISGSCQLMSYFYEGLALAYNPAKKTWGLVNEKLQLVVPAIYDKIDTKEEGRRYGYGNSVSLRRKYDDYPGFTNYYANIKDGKLKVTLKGNEQIISVAK